MAVNSPAKFKDYSMPVASYDLLTKMSISQAYYQFNNPMMTIHRYGVVSTHFWGPDCDTS